MIQTEAKDPRLMLNIQPNIATMRDCQNVQNMLTEELTRIHLITGRKKPGEDAEKEGLTEGSRSLEA